VSPEGKKQAVELGTVAAITALLEDPVEEVRGQAAAALMA
jgi:hypothetical protein